MHLYVSYTSILKGGRKRLIQRQSCQNLGRSKSLESQTTIPNWTHGDPDIAHFINTFLKTCRRTPWTTSDPIPVIYLLWAQPIWTRRHCYGAITPDTEPSLHGWSLQLTLFKISHYFNPYRWNFLYPAGPSGAHFIYAPTRAVWFFAFPHCECVFSCCHLRAVPGMEWREPEPYFPLRRTMWGLLVSARVSAFVLAPCLP